MSLADFSLGTSSGRRFFRFDTWLSFLLWWYLSLKFWVKLLVIRQSILRKFYIVCFMYHSLVLPDKGWGGGFSGPPDNKTDVALKLLFCLALNIMNFPTTYSEIF